MAHAIIPCRPSTSILDLAHSVPTILAYCHAADFALEPWLSLEESEGNRIKLQRLGTGNEQVVA